MSLPVIYPGSPYDVDVSQSQFPGVVAASVDQYGFSPQVVLNDGSVMSSVAGTQITDAAKSAFPPDYSFNPAALLLPGSLGKGLAGAFVFGQNANLTKKNLAPPAPGQPVSDGTITGTPTYTPYFATFSNGNYLTSTLTEARQYTVVAVCRLRDRGANGGATIFCNHATDSYIHTTAADGAITSNTRFGAYGLITQPSSTSLAGAISNRVSYAKQATASLVLNYVSPSLSISDVSQWRMVAFTASAMAVADGTGGVVQDLTGGTTTGSTTAGPGFMRFANFTQKFRIGCDLTPFYHGLIDMAMFCYWTRVLSATELTNFRSRFQPFLEKRRISI